tara:strand:+ start:337 stop:906 length:570 start_codon:yes stop_codon:yes gene_type:complete
MTDTETEKYDPIDRQKLKYVTIKRAVKVLGINENAIRQRIKRNKMQTQKGNDGRIRVAVPSDVIDKYDSRQVEVQSGPTIVQSSVPEFDGTELMTKLEQQYLARIKEKDDLLKENKETIKTLQKDLETLRQEYTEKAIEIKDEVIRVLKEKNNTNNELAETKEQKNELQNRYTQLTTQLGLLMNKIGIK